MRRFTILLPLLLLAVFGGATRAPAAPPLAAGRAAMVAPALAARPRPVRLPRAVKLPRPVRAHITQDGSPLKVSVEDTTGWGVGVDAMFRSAGLRYERLDVGNGSQLSTVAKALSDGMTPLVLFDPGAGGSLGGVPASETAAEVVSLAQRLNELAATYPIMNNMRVIEFGNEVYRREGVAAYAAQYDAAHQALAANGLSSWKLLAVATAVCGSLHDQHWIPSFIAHLSGGAAEVDGWTVHPYGSMNTDASQNCAGPYGYGWPDVRDWHQIAVSHGSVAPWYVTEVGQCISAGTDCPHVVSPDTQAADLTRYLNNTVTRYPWVVYFNWYTSCDDSTGGYGLLAENSDGVCGANGASDRRPAFTALARWLAANGGG